MVRRRSLFLAVAGVVCLLARASDAYAKDTSSDSAPVASSQPPEDEKRAPAGDDSGAATAPKERPPADAHPPELIDDIVPEYPPDALRAGVEGTVVLRLAIDAEGNVTEAEVMEPAGHGFDEAARAAALRTRYRPARRGEKNVASRILTRVEFRLPDANARTAQDPELAGAESGTDVANARNTGATARPEPSTPEEPLDVTVRGPSEAQRLRESAEAVTVVETDCAQRESADLGEVLARTQGVGVRRGGGLGSTTRFSLNGLTDDQVRFFLDGVPLEYAGYPFGIANVPVNLVERVEIYSGVVPIRFGADALGGAVNLVTDQDVRGTHAGASYEVGSFDTHRVTLGGRHLHGRSGFFTRVSGFFDYTKNDYTVDVEVPDERGRLSPARVHRFHDSYQAAGANAELGFVERPWAKRLLLRAFWTGYDKEYQHNAVMTVPYGEVTYGETSTGATLRYEHDLGHGVSVDALGGYARIRGTFLDVANCVYDWFGRCVRERRQPGETDSRPHDQVFWDRSAFGRVNLGWRFHPEHALRASIAPTYVTRTGDERRQSDPSARDPLTAERELTTVVSGLEYELDLFDDRLENIFFVKDYRQLLESEEPRPGGIFRRRDRDTHEQGVGDSLRFRLATWLYAKASYEHATRLPRPDEVFGDNAFVIANLELEPEKSHNANLGLTLDARDTGAGAFRGGVNGFLRDAEELIVLLGNDRVQSYQNVYAARSLGVEGVVGWSAPNELFVWDINLTYVDFRNTSEEGTFGDFAGDRIPNRPYLFANYSARFQVRGVASPRDEAWIGWNTRYVHEYFRGWESVGLREFKQVTPAQFVHGAGLGYLVRSERTELSVSVEVQNLTDEAVFDFYGVQRPGRAFYVKTTAEF